MKLRIPWVTLGILAVLVAMFALEILFGVGPTSGMLHPDITTLQAFGGMQRPLVQEGEWWRTMTAAFLHADAMHILFNGVALVFGGAVLEQLIGKVWLLALFFVGAVGGSLMGYVLNPPNLVSIGASGAIMCLLAAAVVSTFRLPAHQRGRYMYPLLRILVPSMIPLFSMGGTGGKVDYAAHLGGALVGGVFGLLLLVTWGKDQVLPRFRSFAAVLAVAGAGVAGFGFFQVARGFHEYAEVLTTALLPNADLPKGMNPNANQLADWLTKYPKDPRVHAMYAFRLRQADDMAGFERELRLALDDILPLKKQFPNGQYETALRGALAEHLAGTERLDEARRIAAPICGKDTEAPVIELKSNYANVCP